MLAEGCDNKERLPGCERFIDQRVLQPHQPGLQEEGEVLAHAPLIYPAVTHRKKVEPRQIQADSEEVNHPK